MRTAQQRLAASALTLIFALSAPSASAQTASRAAPKPAAPAPEPPKPPPSSATLPGALVFDSGSGSDADPAGKARARALYEQGAQAYSEARYLRAAELFIDAHRVYPTPQLLFNVGKAYDRAGGASAALSYFRDYLRHLPDAPDHAEVTARVRELEASLAERGVQQLSVVSEPALATVVLDGSAVGVTPWTGETWPGKHRLVVELSGKKPSSTLIEVSAHRAEDFRFVLESPPPPVALPRAPVNPKQEKSGAPSALTWVVLATGAAALGTALFVEMANQDAGGISRTGAFFGGAGLSACAVGGVLLYVDFRSDSSTTAAGRALGASVSGRF